MHPQSELENYKLQVELLQEKLHRSEDNRQELEAKLEQILKKRSEHEKILRSRTQKKYQQFLEDQKKRNERNRKLIEMLEHVDHQAAELSARSKRLKSMKIQYEMYFSKLVQSYSLNVLQNVSATPIQSAHGQASTFSLVKTENAVSESQQSSFNAPIDKPQIQTVPLPILVPISNSTNRLPRNWGFSTVPPGVLITLPNTPAILSTQSFSDTKRNELAFGFDYTQFPIGYLSQPGTSIHPEHNRKTSYSQESHQQIQSQSILTPELSSVDNSQLSRSHFDYGYKHPSLFSNFDDRTNDTILNGNQTESRQRFLNPNNDNRKNLDDRRISEGLEKSEEIDKNKKYRRPEVLNDDSSVPSQGLKSDKLPKINSNKYSEPETENGRIVYGRGNEFNATDFLTDDNDEYIKSTKGIKETYSTNVSAPSSVVASQQQSIDNITTALQVQKIDETNVKDDEKIDEDGDNEKNTSLAFSPLGGKCSMESIDDEALTEKSLEKKTKENTSNATGRNGRNIDPSKDTEQITLFNGTKNSIQEGTGASNRTSVAIDDGGENIEIVENIHSETSSYRPKHFDRKEKMSIENIEKAIYGELLTKSNGLISDKPRSNVKEHIATQGSNRVEDADRISSQITADVGQGPVNINDGENRQLKIEELHEERENNQNYNEPQSNIDSYVDNKDEQLEKAPEEDFQKQPQQFAYSENGETSQIDHYPDYQNYDPSQYQENYDPNAYQYDYEQQQYNYPNEDQYTDPNQTQYTDTNHEQYINLNQESYMDAGQEQYVDPINHFSQEYQQDSYPEQYENYDQNVVEENALSNQEQLNEQVLEQQMIHPYPEQEAYEAYMNQQHSTDSLQANDDLKPAKREVVSDVQEGSSNQEPSTVVNEFKEEDPIQRPTSILASEKNSDTVTVKKKKRVNFVDSETDESSNQLRGDAVSSESDFDFSTSN